MWAILNALVFGIECLDNIIGQGYLSFVFLLRGFLMFLSYLVSGKCWPSADCIHPRKTNRRFIDLLEDTSSDMVSFLLLWFSFLSTLGILTFWTRHVMDSLYSWEST